jgi:hypothetical protein
MDNLDLKKTYKYLYGSPKGKQVIVDVPPLQYLMIDGQGDPNSSDDYALVVQTLYAISYKARFMVKKRLEKVYTVPPLEGLWYAPNMEVFTDTDKSKWHWTMMILQPDFITAALIEEAMIEAAKKKEMVDHSRVRLETYEEGQAAQILYLGAYADEGPTIAALHAFIEEQGGTMRGKHHEIYLSDPRKVAPEKLKTIIRQPFR